MSSISAETQHKIAKEQERIRARSWRISVGGIKLSATRSRNPSV